MTVVIWRVFIVSLVLGSATVGDTRTVGQVSTSTVSVQSEMVACGDEKTRIQAGLRAVFADFQRAATPRDIATLVALDRRIRELLRARPSYRPCGRDDAKIYDDRWQAIGVHTGYWSDLTYSGRLLVDAHKIDPKSPLRRHTLYSTVFGVTPAHGLGMMPNVAAAVAYTDEFPDGPFLKDALATIADFHKDLFMVLRDGRQDYKFKCFETSIDATPWPAQRERARRIALEHYDRLLRLAPDDATVRRFSDELTRGVITAWSFCAD